MMSLKARQAHITRIFLSCAEEDKEFLEDLVRQLSTMVREGHIQCCHRYQFKPGSDWREQVRKDLDAADIILLLVSSYFTASDYCYQEEVVPAMAQQKIGKACVIPVILRPVEWEKLIFGNLKSLPTGEALSMWSNRDDALANIARGVKEVVDDLRGMVRDAIQGGGKPSSYWNVPYWRNPFFTDREDVLANLQRAFSPAQALPRIQALSGLAGVGKTQVAAEYAYRHAHSYQAILWVHADSSETLQSSFVDLAETLGLPEKDEANQLLIVRTVKQWLQRNSRWLLVVDNLEDIALLRDVVPSPHSGHILVTTRSRRTGQVARRVDVPALHIDEGALLLLRRTNVLPPGATLDTVSTEDSTSAKAIAQEVGGLPLALDQAGAYIEETGRGLSDYVGLYQQYSFALLQRRGGSDQDHPASVATTFSLSFARMRERNAAAVELLEFCAFLHPDAIPEDMLVDGASVLPPALRAVGTNPIEFDRTIEDVLKFSLIQREPTRAILIVHRLVQIIIKGMMSEERQKEFVECIVRVIDTVFPVPELANWTRCQKYLPQAQVCAGLVKQYQVLLPEAAQFLCRVGIYLSERGLYDEAEALLVQAGDLTESLFGKDHPDNLPILNALANVFYKKGKYAQVEPLLLWAIELCERAFGEDYPEIAQSLNTLARAYHRQGRFTESEPLLLRALALRQRVLGSQHPDVATSLDSLATFYNGRGKYAQAEALYREALTIWQQVLAPRHPKTALNMNNLAVLYSRQGKYAQAEPLAEQAQAMYEEILGPEHPDVATVLDTLTVIYQEQEKYRAAENLYQRIFAIYDRHLGREHPQLVVCYNNRARLYFLQGRYREAEETVRQALALGEKVLGERHHRVGTSLNILADICKAQQKYPEAEDLYQQALSIREQALGPNDLNTAQTLENYADLLQLMGRRTEAEILGRRVKSIREIYFAD